MGQHYEVPQKHSVISIVDDDEIAREATADLLSSLGFQQSRSICGEISGLRKSPRHFLPHHRFANARDSMDLSCRVIWLLRGMRFRSSLSRRIGRRSARQQAISVGAVAFLSKPFHEASLVELLEIAFISTSHLVNGNRVISRKRRRLRSAPSQPRLLHSKQN